MEVPPVSSEANPVGTGGVGSMKSIDDESELEDLVDLSGLDAIDINDIDLDGVERCVVVPAHATCPDCGWENHSTRLVPVRTTKDRAGLPIEVVSFEEISDALIELRRFLTERHHNTTFGRCLGFLTIKVNLRKEEETPEAKPPHTQDLELVQFRAA